MQVVLFAVTASAALVVGAVVGVRWALPRAVLAALLAFASGALSAALAFELFEVSFAEGGLLKASLGLAAGAATFVAVDTLLDRRMEHGDGSRTGFALFAAVTLDGVPENLALGTTLAAGKGSSALLVAIVVSNLPEALVGARALRDDGRPASLALGTWAAAAALLAMSIVAGAVLLDGLDDDVLSIVLAFAGGAVLASLADTLFPKAYADGGPWVGLATAAGFLLAVALGASG